VEKKRTNHILLVLFFGVLMGALDIAIVGPALPAMRSSFAAAGNRSMTWVFSVYVLFNLIGTPIMAKLSDISGRRMIYALDLLLFAVGSLTVALSPSLLFVLLGRGIQGFGAGGIFPVASAVIGDTFPPERRGRALGLIGAVFGLAFIVGPALAGLILRFATWHWLFLINVPVALTLLGFGLHVLPSQKSSSPGRFDWSGTLLLSLTLASLAYGLNSIDTSNFTASISGAHVLPFLLAALALIPVTALIERKAASPVLPGNVFASRQLRIGYVLTAGAGVGEAAVVFMPSLAIASISGVQPHQASFLLMPVVLALAVGSPLAGRLLDGVGSRVVITSGLVIAATGMVMLSVTAGSMLMFIVSGVLIGIGLSALLGAPIRYITLNEVEPSNRSAAQGAVTVFTSSGQLLGAAIIGAIAASGNGSGAGYARAFLVTGIIAAVMILAAARLKNRVAEATQAERQKTGAHEQS